MKLYFWILGVHFEPQYSLARRILTKTICVTSIIDDIYDVYGTQEELKFFIDAIKRFSKSIYDSLHLKWIHVMIHSKYYKFKDVSSAMSFKIFIDVAFYT